MSLGGYSATLNLNVEENLFPAVMLVVYEHVMVYATLFFASQHYFVKDKLLFNQSIPSLNSKGKRVYAMVALFSLVILLCCFFVTPNLGDMYRPITKIGDEFFTNFEDSYFISKYGTTFVSKLSMVVGMYFMRFLLLFFPAVIIVFCHENGRNSIISKIISSFCCIIPLFFIGGAIARSLIYVVCLFLLREYLFNSKKVGAKIFLVGVVCIFVIVWWWMFFKINASLSVFESFSARLSAYFSGVNIVSGVFNLPDDWTFRLKYFFYDYLTTIPFGHTLFGISDQTVQQFFNQHNNSFGQIPTTIGMGYYYFGSIFSPLYSMVFAFIAYVSCHKLESGIAITPFQYIRFLYSTFVFCMGIVMYNIEISMILFFGVIVPMFLVEKIAYGAKIRNS